MLKLIIGDEEGKVQNANIPVRWCVDKETLKKLEEDDIVDPYILLVVVSNKREISRQICPLDRLVDYVYFHRPEENKIYATIVWHSDGRKGLWKKFLKKEDGYYGTDLICQGDFYTPSKSVEFAEIDVIIPLELFAKEYPQWLKRWVNLWFKEKPKDQCHFRKRAIVAFTIQPPMMFLWTLFIKLIPRWIIVILLIAGGYWFYFDDWNPKTWKFLWNMKPLFHPWRYDLKNLFSDAWNEAFGGRGYEEAAVLLLSVYILALIGILSGIGYVFWKIFCVIFKPFAKPISKTIVNLADITGKLFSKIPWDKLVRKTTALDKWETPEKKQEFIARQYTIYQTLLCENVEKIEPIKIVPLRHKIHLQFQDLKAKVCKPMPR